MIRALFLSHVPNNPNGGASRIYHVLTDALRARGHDITLLHLEDFGMPRHPKLEVLTRRTVLPYYVSRGAKKRASPEGFDVIMASSGTAWPLFKSLHRHGDRAPLLVHHLHGLAHYDHLANLAESKLGHFRVGLPYRLVTGPFQVRWDNGAFPYSDVVIVQNTRDLAEAAQRVARIARNAHVELIPAALSPVFSSTFSAVDQSTTSKTHSKLLWFATWEARKGAAYMPAMLRELRSQRPEITLTVGGTGKSPDEIRAHFDPQDRTAVNVLGRVSVEEQVALFDSHDVYVFPSISEGFGLALLEAMANGMPAVTAPTGFGADFVEHEKTGMVVPPDAFAGAVRKLLDDPGLARRIAAEGRDLARTFTTERFVDHYEQTFLHGIDRKKAQR
jgi:glycosyltransferase involved in cell wall biosynthesis